MEVEIATTEPVVSGELVVPTVSKVVNVEVARGSVETMLNKIVESCSSMDELTDAWTSLSHRLVTVVDELVRRETNNEPLPPSDVLAQLAQTVADVDAALERCGNHSLLTRLTQHSKRERVLQSFHEQIDAIAMACDLPSATTEWTAQWTTDRGTAMRLLGVAVNKDSLVLTGLIDAAAQVQALTQLKFYVDRPGTADDLIKLFKKASSTIAQEASTVVTTLPPWYVPADDVEFDTEPFAQGSFGAVHHGTWHGGERVVVKRLLHKGAMTEILKERFMDEVSIWHKLDHPNVLKLYGASHVSSPPFFVCQRASHNNMATYLASSPRARRNLWQLVYGAAQGLAYIHKNYIVHGDLKLNNILVDQPTPDAPVVALVGDFGLSFVRPAPSTTAVQPLAAEGARPRGGGLRWRSPESLKKRPTFASDIYSLGMCMIEALTGEPPYGDLDDEHVHKELKEGNIPPRPEQFTDDAWVLVQSMTQFEPSGRLSLNEVLTVLADFAAVEKADNETFDKEQADAEASETRAVEVPPASPRGRRNTGSTPGAGIVPLVQLLRAGTPDQMHYAAHTLGDLASDTEENRRDIVKAGGIPLLAEMVLHPTSELLHDEATRVLQFLATDGDTCVLIANAGCTALLVPLLHTGTAQQKQAVAFSLSTFLAADGKTSIPVDANAIRSLVQLLTTGDEGQKAYAVRALSNLAASHATDATITSVTVIAPLLKLVQSGNDEQSLYALKALSGLAAQPNVCAIMSESNGVAAFLGQLYTVGEDHQQYALTALRHLVKASTNNCVTIVDVGGIAPLIELLRGEPGVLKQLAAEILQHMVHANKRLASAVFSAGIVPPLAEILRVGEPPEKLSAAETLGQLAKDVATSGAAIAEAGATPLLVEMFQRGNDKHKATAEFALKALLQDEDSCLAIAEHGGYAIIFDMLQRGTPEQKTAAVFVVAVSFAVDSDPASKATVRRLEPLIGFLRTGSDKQKTLALDVFKKLASIGMNRASLVAGGIVPSLLLLVSGRDGAHKSLATHVLAQLATDDEGVEAIISHDGIDTVAAYFVSNDTDDDASAALTLGRLATDAMHCAAIAKAGVVASTMHLLHKGNALQQERAAYLVSRLAQDPSVHASITSNGGIQLFETLLAQAEGSKTQKEYAAMALAGLLTSPQDIEVVTRLELLTALVELLDHGNDGGKLGAAASLAAIAEQHPERMEMFLLTEKGNHMVPLLIALLRTGVGGQREHAAQALGRCASLNEGVRQTFVTTGGIDVLARQLQLRTESATAQTLPLLKALAPIPAHATAFQTAKVVPHLVGVLTSGSCPETQQREVVETLVAFTTFVSADATEVVTGAQQLLRSESVVEQEVGATLVAHVAASAPKIVAQRGVVTELVAVLSTKQSPAKLAAVKALLALADESCAKDALKTANVGDAVIKLLDATSDSDPVAAPAEKLAVSLGRSKLLSREHIEKWLVPRLEQVAATGGSGPRVDFARDAVGSFKAKRSSFTLGGGRTRSMSSEQSNHA